MNYADLKSKDTANGVGFGVALFVSGCRNHCEGCFNPETWNFDYGEPFTNEVEDMLFELLDRPYVDYFSILGGDPFELENRETVLKIVKDVRLKFPDLKINIWSGYLFEDLCRDELCLKVLNLCDILVDGKFEQDKYDYKLHMRGSYNQRIIDLKESLNSNKIVCLSEDNFRN